MLMSVCLSVCLCLCQTCLEQSIFIFLGQRALREPSEHSESNQRVLEHSESTKRAIKALKSELTVGAFKYCVLLV